MRRSGRASASTAAVVLRHLARVFAGGLALGPAAALVAVGDAAAEDAASTTGTGSPAFACPEGMVPVAGTHYAEVQRVCNVFRQQKCFSYRPDFVGFEGARTDVRVCVDRYEWPNQKGAPPAVMRSYDEASAACRGVGKRLCTEFEWELACEGPDALGFGYGPTAVPGTCNVDKPYRTVSEAKLASNDPAVRERETARLWQGEGAGEREGCVSPFGVHDLLGNAEEWVATSRPEWAYPSSLKGGYWSKPWAGCRGTNDSHGPAFRFYEIGFRCCRDPD